MNINKILKRKVKKRITSDILAQTKDRKTWCNRMKTMRRIISNFRY
jgi:hypothetical protein